MPHPSVPPSAKPRPSSWKSRYGDRHRPRRITDFPAGVAAPQKVRIYQRGDHYLLQWWDPAAKHTLTQRVEGDLIDALAGAREIDRRVVTYGRSGAVATRVGHEPLVDAFLADLSRRAEAGEINERTVKRYSTALKRHYLPFVGQPAIAKRFPRATDVKREFQQELAQFLRGREVTSNGRAAGRRRPLQAQSLVLGVVRSMFHWAADGDRGNLLPDGFRNPFHGSGRKGNAFPIGSLAAPDITLDMAVEFLRRCDAYQLPIFTLLALGGLRPDELGWLFVEHIHKGWLHVVSLPTLEYATKGRRDKQLLLPSQLLPLWLPKEGIAREGLLFHRRDATETTRRYGCFEMSLEELGTEFTRRVHGARQPNLSQRTLIRDRLMREAGGLSYDRTRQEFVSLQAALGWPPAATLKDFRHLFATALENAGVPQTYRQFFMGHSPGRAPIVTYTHLDQLERHLGSAHASELAPLIDAAFQRGRELGLL